MNESFTMTSRNGKREVSAFISGGGMSGQRGWSMSFTRRTATRSETRSGWARTKGDAVERAKAFIAEAARTKKR